MQYFFYWTTNITKTPLSDCINTNITYFLISFEAVFIKMLWKNDKMFFLGSSPPLLYWQPRFPDTRAFAFARQPMKQNFIWSKHSDYWTHMRSSWTFLSRLKFCFAKKDLISIWYWQCSFLRCFSLTIFLRSSKLWSINLRIMFN